MKKFQTRHNYSLQTYALDDNTNALKITSTCDIKGIQSNISGEYKFIRDTRKQKNTLFNNNNVLLISNLDGDSLNGVEFKYTGDIYLTNIIIVGMHHNSIFTLIYGKYNGLTMTNIKALREYNKS